MIGCRDLRSSVAQVRVSGSTIVIDAVERIKAIQRFSTPSAVRIWFFREWNLVPTKRLSHGFARAVLLKGAHIVAVFSSDANRLPNVSSPSRYLFTVSAIEETEKFVCMST